MTLWSPFFWAPPDSPAKPALHVLDLSRHFEVVQTPADVDTWQMTGTPAAHILDLDADARYWLIPRNARTRSWSWAVLRRYVTVYDTPLRLPVPGPRTVAGPGPQWVRPSRSKATYVADPDALLDDLTAATLPLGPPGRTCHLCPHPVWPDVEVAIAALDAPRRPLPAHQACAHAFGYAPAPGTQTWRLTTGVEGRS